MKLEFDVVIQLFFSNDKMLNLINAIPKAVILLLPIIQLTHGDGVIDVKRSGVKTFEPGMTSLTLFATVESKGSQAVAVGLEMEKCCQEVTANDTDCHSMTLHNGLRVELSPGEVKNLTLYYSNHYLVGRVGDCWVKVKWRQGSKGSSTEPFKIHFDTHPSLTTFLQKILSLVPGRSYRVCESVDEDPQRECLPVNCLLKYSGFRSFYNHTVRKCQKTPKCIDLDTLTPEMEKKPNVILSPVSNKCKNINTAVKFNEKMKELQDITEVAALSFAKYPVNVKCVHGHRNGSEELCVCDPTWTSKNFVPETFNPEHDTYVMCDMPSSLEPPSRLGSTSLKVLIGGLIVLFALVLCIYLPCVLRRCINRGRLESMTSELASSSSSSSESTLSIISEVKSPRSVILPPLSPIPTKSKMLEFSDLLREEKTTKPASSTPRLEYSTQKHILRYPENFQLKPPVWPRSPQPLTPSTSTSESSSSLSADLPIPSFSIPNTSEVLPYFEADSFCIPLTSSCSLDSFPRRILSSTSCSCSCCDNNNNSLQPLVTVRIHPSDVNANTVVTLRRLCPRQIEMKSEVHCEGALPTFVKTNKSNWTVDLEKLMGNVCLENVDSSASPISSRQKSTWSEFLGEAENTKFEVRPLWITEFVNSIKMNEKQ